MGTGNASAASYIHTHSLTHTHSHKNVHTHITHTDACTQLEWVSLAYESRITVKWLAVRLKLPNIPNGHAPVTRWCGGLSSLSSIFTVFVILLLQSAFLGCHFQQVPGTTFPLATPSQKSWSYSEDPGISSMCGVHAPRCKSTHGFARPGLWLKMYLAEKITAELEV